MPEKIPAEKHRKEAPAGHADHLARLREVPAFAELPEPLLDGIADVAAFAEAPAETMLFRQGEQPEALHVLLRGQVALEATSNDSASTIIEILMPIELFQLSPALLAAPYLVSARVLGDAQLLVIPLAPFRRLLESEPRLAFLMVESISRNYRRLLHQVRDLKLRSAAQRLGCFILGLSRQQDFPERIKLPFDKQFLAKRLGTTPENLSRAFATLRGHGVQTSGSHVVVTDAMRLAAFAVPDETG
jgi:CRP/FNR family transcriptional activator FtrB